MELTTDILMDFHKRQLEAWPLADAGFKGLAEVRCKEVEVGDVVFKVQHNRARIRSTGAKVDKASVAQRPCFLCDVHRPSEQMELVAGNGYKILVNPFPIFPVHFTIPAELHVPQLISADGCGRFMDMVRFAGMLPGLALFYNGPACGASAPDHFHFQAVERAELPLLQWVEDGRNVPFEIISAMFHSPEEARRWLVAVCGELMRRAENNGEPEPRMNVVCSAVCTHAGVSGNAGDRYGGIRVVVIPRRAHRPDFYGTGENQVLLSPASVDLSGGFIVPSPADFEQKVTPALIREVIRQTCYAEFA